MDVKKIRDLKGLPLEAIASRYGFSFSQVGDKLRGLCLFHGDSNTPNLFLYPDDTFFCYSCRRGGSKADFVAYAERVDKSYIRNLWEDMNPLCESLALALEDSEADYKPHAQLLISKAFFSARKKHPELGITVCKDLDYWVASTPKISKVAYDDIAVILTDILGGIDHDG